jgi:apolipoprotein N-acyltransferase
MLVLAAGIVHALSLPPSWIGWVVPVVPMLLLLGLARARTTRWSAAAGWTYGMVLHLGVFHWLLRIPDTPAWVLAVAYIALALVGGGFPALLAWLYSRSLRYLSRFQATLLFPFLWVGMESIRGYGLLGFPWVDLATSLAPFPVLIQPAAIGGSAALGLIAASVGTCCALAIDSAVWRHPVRSRGGALAIALILIAGWWWFGHRRLAQPRAEEGRETARVALVQGNIDPTQKWQPEHAWASLDLFADETGSVAATEHPDLVVWPETAIPCLLEGESPTVCGLWIQNLARRTKSTLLVGALAPGPDVSGQRSYYNSAYLISPDGNYRDRYDKVHLVPFGEMIPLDDKIEVLRRIDLGEGDFVAGESRRAIGEAPLRLGVVICFESLFSGSTRALARDGARLLVIMTNDAWFGDSAAPEEHAAVAALRAVETGLAIARCANTGISGFVDPVGRYLDRTQYDTRQTLVAELPLALASTPFVRWGDIVGSLCALWCIALALAEVLSLAAQKDRK